MHGCISCMCCVTRQHAAPACLGSDPRRDRTARSPGGHATTRFDSSGPGPRHAEDATGASARAPVHVRSIRCGLEQPSWNAGRPEARTPRRGPTRPRPFAYGSWDQLLTWNHLLAACLPHRLPGAVRGASSPSTIVAFRSGALVRFCPSSLLSLSSPLSQSKNTAGKCEHVCILQAGMLWAVPVFRFKQSPT